MSPRARTWFGGMAIGLSFLLSDSASAQVLSWPKNDRIPPFVSVEEWRAADSAANAPIPNPLAKLAHPLLYVSQTEVETTCEAGPWFFRATSRSGAIAVFREEVGSRRGHARVETGLAGITHLSVARPGWLPPTRLTLLITGFDSETRTHLRTLEMDGQAPLVSGETVAWPPCELEFPPEARITTAAWFSNGLFVFDIARATIEHYEDHDCDGYPDIRGPIDGVPLFPPPPPEEAAPPSRVRLSEVVDFRDSLGVVVGVKLRTERSLRTERARSAVVMDPLAPSGMRFEPRYSWYPFYFMGPPNLRSSPLAGRQSVRVRGRSGESVVVELAEGANGPWRRAGEKALLGNIPFAIDAVPLSEPLAAGQWIRVRTADSSRVCESLEIGTAVGTFANGHLGTRGGTKLVVEGTDLCGPFVLVTVDGEVHDLEGEAAQDGRGITVVIPAFTEIREAVLIAGHGLTRAEAFVTVHP